MLVVFQILGAWCAASLVVGALWIVLAMAIRRPVAATSGDAGVPAAERPTARS